jgi:uncharacterized protein (DUF885 family)
MSLEEIEQVGRRNLTEAEDTLLRLHRADRGELQELLQRLRHHDRTFYADQLLAVSREAVRRGIASVPKLFVRTTVAPVVIEVLPTRLESSLAAAYHGSHGPDDPATFALNLSRPPERQLTAEAIAFHETLPGHHASEGLGYPRGGPSSGFLEGWGTYAEQLADEMGLYSTPFYRAGMLTKRLSVAVRPIVEVGIHAKGWTRMDAMRFMYEHTAMSEAEVEVEVDRLIAGPGQGSSYILGYDHLMRLRARAQAELGPAFDLRQFHDQVLRKGARPLKELDHDIDVWISSLRE